MPFAPNLRQAVCVVCVVGDSPAYLCVGGKATPEVAAPPKVGPKAVADDGAKDIGMAAAGIAVGVGTSHQPNGLAARAPLGLAF